jgi:hypothetical protein
MDRSELTATINASPSARAPQVADVSRMKDVEHAVREDDSLAVGSKRGGHRRSGIERDELVARRGRAAHDPPSPDGETTGFGATGTRSPKRTFGENDHRW